MIADVTACLVTRGDQPEKMDEIIRSLVFANVKVWDNSRHEDRKCYGRYRAAAEATTELVYFQDDDVLVPVETQLALLDEYLARDVEIVANWGHGEDPAGYEDLPLVCGGAITTPEACERAVQRYLDAGYELDEAFDYEADFVIGILYQTIWQVRLPFEIDYAIAQAPERLCNQDWQADLKFEMTKRARGIAYGVAV